MHSTSRAPAGAAPEAPPERASCAHAFSHIVDSRTHGHGYSTDESRRIFCDHCRLQRWLDVEVALSASQAELGMIPASAAQRIAASAQLAQLDLDRVSDGIRRSGHSFVALCDELARVAGPEAARFVHLGATTQDIQDTAQSLELRDVLDGVERDVRALLHSLRALAVAHRDALMMGRTHTQPALPTTFGVRVAGWIDELLGHVDRLRETRARVLVAQLFGGVGTMAAFGARGPELLERFAARLGLGVPATAWHVSRDRVAEYTITLALVSASAARMADEIRLLAHPEFGELHEGWSYGAIGSSTMPHKRNPETCEQVVVLARLSRALASPALEAMVQEHDRDYRGTRMEWVIVPDAAHYALTCLALMRQVLDNLQVRQVRMAERAEAGAELICSEALMLALAEHVGKPRAFELLYQLTQGRERASLRHAAKSHPEIGGLLGAEAIDRALDPRQHLGSAGVLVEQVVARVDTVLATPR